MKHCWHSQLDHSVKQSMLCNKIMESQKYYYDTANFVLQLFQAQMSIYNEHYTISPVAA